MLRVFIIAFRCLYVNKDVVGIFCRGILKFRVSCLLDLKNRESKRKVQLFSSNMMTNMQADYRKEIHSYMSNIPHLRDVTTMMDTKHTKKDAYITNKNKTITHTSRPKPIHIKTLIFYITGKNANHIKPNQNKRQV